MKAALLVAMIAVTLPFCAQTPTSGLPATQTAQVTLYQPPLTSRQPSMVVVSAELTRGLDARKLKSGDPVFAKCTQDFSYNGEVLIPRNTKLIGHIAAVQTKGRGQPESTIAIAFDKAIMRDGREVPLAGSIQALAPPVFLEGELSSPDFQTQKLAKPRASGLLPGALKTPAPEIFSTTPLPLTANLTGAVGLKGLQLEPVSASATNSSVIRSNSQNVRLESGTRLILRVSLP